MIKDKIIDRIKEKNKKRNLELEKRRNEARLNYPVDVRIYIAEKIKRV